MRTDARDRLQEIHWHPVRCRASVCAALPHSVQPLVSGAQPDEEAIATTAA